MNSFGSSSRSDEGARGNVGVGKLCVRIDENETVCPPIKGRANEMSDDANESGTKNSILMPVTGVTTKNSRKIYN